MISIIHLGLLISIIFNYLSLWSITKYLRSQDQSIDALTKLVLAIADKHIYNVPHNVVPINLKKP